MVTYPVEYKGRWNELFSNGNKKLRLEIGCGKGAFITTLARKNPDINYIAIEKVPDVLVMALEKAFNAKIPNLKFINCDAAHLNDYFNCGEVDLIYLNFSDPWPKNRNLKRRLSHKNFLEMYKEILRPEGAVFLKTDNSLLFEFSLNEFSDFGCRLKNITFDLHNSGYAGNIMTEYEKRFCDEGKPIYRCEAYFI